ncbi:phospholipid phosphatase 1-like isoform X1 [Hylaeus volcanicus]|uniref:phospholipid phosphatase 1-like isoform X1 n=1 Tax=Hylaeus volcanicus TaxID=313075 RepID=UPI0023B87393|nr:phospholipid phosphatase 1-like isoform X1 [Hylaeus volcanicus]
MQRSTEQLTHCSSTTLEEIQDNTDGVTTRTVSEKIMSICKSTVRWVLLLDIFLALTVIVILALLEFGTVPQQRIGFYCNDPKISFKFLGDTISISLLLTVSLLLPLVVMFLVEYLCHPENSYTTTSGCSGSRVKQVWFWYGHYLIGTVCLIFLCDVMKTLIGEPRPHFLDTCKPLEAHNCTDGYVRSYTCTNTNDSTWFISDSSKSFPSGHSALSMFATIFMVWYLQNRLPNRTFLLKPWLQCLISLWTVVCSLTRIGDNRHHWWDVLAGVVLGTIFSVLTVTVQCNTFRLNRIAYNEPVENRQINFNMKTHHNVKKLLQETTVDLHEGRELKNTSSNWKE